MAAIIADATDGQTGFGGNGREACEGLALFGAPTADAPPEPGTIRTIVALEVFGTSWVSLGVLLLFAAVLAADSEEIGVGAGAVHQIDCVVMQDEFC
jgi:hypothetical protein